MAAKSRAKAQKVVISGKVLKLQSRTQLARMRTEAARRQARLAKQQAKAARKLFKSARQVAKRAKAELAELSRKLKKVLEGTVAMGDKAQPAKKKRKFGAGKRRGKRATTAARRKIKNEEK